MRGGFTDEALGNLVFGITGQKPAQMQIQMPGFLEKPGISSPKLRHTPEKLFGRDDALARLDAAWDDKQTNVVVIRAWGGVGKTLLVAEWMARLAGDAAPWRGARRLFD